MLSDAPKRRQIYRVPSTKRRFRIPRFTRRVSPTEWGGLLGSFAFGMIVIFPLMAFLAIGAPKAVVAFIGVSAVVTGLLTKSWRSGVMVGIVFIGAIVLGFVSIAIAANLIL